MRDNWSWSEETCQRWGRDRRHGGGRARGWLTIATGKEGLSAQHLCEDTSDAPHIDGTGILLEGEHDLGSSIPSVHRGSSLNGDGRWTSVAPGCYVFGHERAAVVGDVGWWTG